MGNLHGDLEPELGTMILRHTTRRLIAGNRYATQRQLPTQRQPGPVQATTSPGPGGDHLRRWISQSTSVHDKKTGQQPKDSDKKHQLTMKEKDEIALQRMKERMGLEGDELWEDGQPMESGMRRNVKNNMFRLI